MELHASFVGLEILSHYSGHYTLSPCWIPTLTRKYVTSKLLDGLVVYSEFYQINSRI